MTVTKAGGLLKKGDCWAARTGRVMNAEAASVPSRKRRSSSEGPFPVRIRLLGGFGVWVGQRAVSEGALPARYGFWAVPGGVGVEVVARRSTEPRVRRAIETRLEERGVPVRELNLVEHPGALQRPLPLRCDLKETAFGVHGARGAHALMLALDESAGQENL